MAEGTRNPANELLTVEEVAELLKIRPDLVRKYIREGRLKAVKMGKFWRVLRRDVESLVNLPPNQLLDDRVDEAWSRNKGPFAPTIIRNQRPQEGLLRRHRITNENQVFEQSPLFRELYQPLDAFIEDFRKQLQDQDAHVEVNESPLWEVTILRPRQGELHITRYTTVPGSGKVAILEGAVDKGGDVRVEELWAGSFRSFLKSILARETTLHP